MSDTIAVMDMIENIFGTWYGIIEDVDARGSKTYRYKYKGANGNPLFPSKSDIKIPKHCILNIEVPIKDGKTKSGQFAESKLILPDRNMKDINFDETVFGQLMKHIDKQSSDAIAENKRLKEQIFFLNKELEQLGKKTKQKSETERMIKCNNCQESFTREELRNAGGFCPNCHKHITRDYKTGDE